MVAWAEDGLPFGPGDLRGQPLILNNEQKAFLYRAYELHPICVCWGKRDCTHESRPGRRRFNRVALSLAKGLAKTELGAVIAAAELHPDSPVRCVNWWKPRGGDWEPEGGPVRSPYIPVLATTEEQVEDLGYGVLLDMLGNSRYGRDFDLGLERIVRWGGDGICQPMSSAPNSKDGALTTFQWFDETHRLYLPNQAHAHQTMLANMAKRPIADPWSLETTTAYATGQGSIAERTMEYARKVAEGKVKDSRLFFYHRQAATTHDLATAAGRRAAVVEARGPEAAAWSDIGRICAQWDDPSTDKGYLARVWLNQPNALAGRAFDVETFRELAIRGRSIPEGALVTLGFDGSLRNDATGIVATEVATGHQQVVGVWENPGRDDWEVPELEVDQAMTEAFARWQVWRAYCDPYWWESWVSAWSGRFGEKRVIQFRTNSLRRIYPALKVFAAAIAREELTHDGNPVYEAHIGNARRHETPFEDSDDKPKHMWTIEKERADSPFKIDLAMAGALSWQARLDALAAGAKPEKRRPPKVLIPA